MTQSAHTMIFRLLFLAIGSAVAGGVLSVAGQASATANASFFSCERCGQKAASVAALTSGSCFRHPDGAYKGRHKLYEGGEKSSYTCKHCGQKAPSIVALVNGSCFRHPDGVYKGRHAPAL